MYATTLYAEGQELAHGQLYMREIVNEMKHQYFHGYKVVYERYCGSKHKRISRLFEQGVDKQLWPRFLCGQSVVVNVQKFLKCDFCVNHV